MLFSAFSKPMYLYSFMIFSSFKNLMDLNTYFVAVRRFTFDGDEGCEWVGSFFVNVLESITRKSNIGLYHDEAVGIFQNIFKPKIERK